MAGLLNSRLVAALRVGADGEVLEVGPDWVGLTDTPVPAGRLQQWVVEEDRVDTALGRVAAGAPSAVVFVTERTTGRSLRLRVADEEGLLVVAENVSERFAVLAETRGIHGLVDFASDAWFVHDQSGGMVDCNRAACESLGYSREELLGLYVHEFETSIEEGALDGLWHRLDIGQTVTAAGRHKRKDGTTFPVEVKLGLFQTAGGEVHLLAVVRNVTEREEAAERLRQAERDARDASLAKSRFLANMSHELRTPLNALIGYAQLVCEETEETQTRADLERMEVSARHLLTLIDQVLDVSKIEAGKLEVRIERVDLTVVMAEIREALGGLVTSGGNTFVVDTDVEAWATDHAKLRQILTNLIGNAAKFTAQGQISVRAKRVKGGVAFSVADTGTGMSIDAQERLFKPFEQVHDTRTGPKGTGLGLTITKGLVELLGGTLEVESALGVGSTFRFTLPDR